MVFDDTAESPFSWTSCAKRNLTTLKRWLKEWAVKRNWWKISICLCSVAFRKWHSDSPPSVSRFLPLSSYLGLINYLGLQLYCHQMLQERSHQQFHRTMLQENCRSAKSLRFLSVSRLNQEPTASMPSIFRTQATCNSFKGRRYRFLTKKSIFFLSF